MHKGEDWRSEERKMEGEEGLGKERQGTRQAKEDQAVEAAIVSVQYTDKAGRLNTLRGNADKLLIKRRHRHHPGK